MSTTQRSESMNRYFKDYVNSSTSMSKFVIQYEKALDAIYNKEREKTFKTMNSKPILKTYYPMEKEASEVYTRKIFRKFQEELVHSQQYVAEKIIVNDEVYSYKVHEFDKEKPKYIVTFVGSSTTKSCSCHMFEFIGILCRHQLTILIKKKVHSFPNHYILNRWTRDAKKGEIESILDEQLDNTPKSSMMLFNSVMVYSLELSEKASRSQKHYDVAIESLQRLFEDLDALKIEDENTSSIDVLISENLLKDQETHILTQNITLLDPPHVITKGRPRSLRMKEASEKNNNSKTCSFCKQKGHTKRTCLLQKQSRCDSSQVIASNLNAPRTYGSIQIDEDSSVAHNWYQGQGSISLQSHLTNFTDLITSMQELSTGTNKKV